MSHSTTATSTYPLAKYSKSYPNGPQTNYESNTAEWQHFTNPSICLVLDIKKGVELESVRLRILWSMDPDGDSDQREVIFEDIDLLTLSCLPQRLTQKQQAQGLPLKAVYRDTLVGIRYLHPINFKNTPMYRRFQITFHSPNSVVEFINAISTVCPCKANPSTNPTPRTMNPPSAPNPHIQTGRLSHIPSTSVIPTASAPSLAQRQQANYRYPSSSPSFIFPSPALPNIYPLRPSSTDSDPCLPSSTSGHIVHSTRLGITGDATKLINQHLCLSTNRQIQKIQEQTSLPSSSPPASSTRDINNHGSGVSPSPNDKVLQDPAAALLNSLQETTSLYSLSRPQLEQLVGQVVQEEGFSKLLEDISSLWGIKSFVGI